MRYLMSTRSALMITFGRTTKAGVPRREHGGRSTTALHGTTISSTNAERRGCACHLRGSLGGRSTNVAPAALSARHDGGSSMNARIRPYAWAGALLSPVALFSAFLGVLAVASLDMGTHSPDLRRCFLMWVLIAALSLLT